MSPTEPADRAEPADRPPSPHRPVPDVWRRVALAVAVVRYAVPLAAVPLIPFLIVDRLPLLILLRPTKEFVLLAGGSLRVLGGPSTALVLAAYVPFMVLAVGAFFVLGRAYRDVIGSPEAPRWLQRAIPPEGLAVTQRVLARRGPAIAVLGRLAALPPTILAAAAGTSDVSAARYLSADLVGAIAAFWLTYGAGWALGEAYERGGSVIAVAGLALFVALVWLLTRWIRAESAAPSADA